MFESLPASEPDVILALMGRFREDPREGKVDLGVGVYRDERGETPVLRAVRTAELRLAEATVTKTYVGLAGDLTFCDLLGREVLGEALTAQAARCQATGGSGALYTLSRLLKLARPGARVHLPRPTWPNHPKLFGADGLEIASYPWLDAAGRGLDFAGAAEALDRLGPGDAVVLHACCHNPTGVDPTAAQWAEIAGIAARRGWLPVFDMAYAGFGDGWEADCAGMRQVMGAVPESLAAVSCSKNFGLYRDRAGAAFACLADPKARKPAQEALEAINRTLHSMPPDHGGALVRGVLEDEALRADWREELASMRARINGNRRTLAEALARRPGGQGWGFVADQRGLFSTLDLTAGQAARLRERHGVYVIPPGRVNFAGLLPGQADKVADALMEVVGAPAEA